MRRRTSGSGAEDDDGLISTTQSAGGNLEDSRSKSKRPSNSNSNSKDAFLMDAFQESQESSADESHRRKSVSPGVEKLRQSSSWESLDEKTTATTTITTTATTKSKADKASLASMPDYTRKHRARLRSPWSCSPVTLSCSTIALLLLFVIVQSFLSRQLDPKGCAMSYMRAAFAKFTDFDTEHTRFASKYSLYLYREGGIDEDTRVRLGCWERIKD